jgi:flagellar hook-associated protein 1 FlgK
MSIGILSSALSGLTAFQRSLETTSNNISNVNTEGYSRQRAELTSLPEQYTGSGYMGSGVRVDNVMRSYDQFISGQVRSSTSAFQEVDSYHQLASQIDNLTADESTGLSPAINEFFDAVSDVANDPTSIPSRQVLLDQADALTHHFNNMSERFSDLRQQVNSNLSNAVEELNGYAAAVAKLNLKIADDIGRASGKQLPNELMDQRDVLLNKIAEKADISVVSQADGTVSVFMGQGQPLVTGGYSTTLSLADSKTEPDRKEILLINQDISKLLSGGEIYGNLRFRDEVLDPAQRQLGLLATGLATEFNSIHQAGFDLTGNTGVNFFDLGTPQVQVSSKAQNSALVATATFVTPTVATDLAARYRLDVTATVPAPNYTLTNLSINTPPIVGLDDTTLAALAPNIGFSVTFNPIGALTTNDSFEFSPVFDAAKNFKLNPAITTPGQIAAASNLNLKGDNSNALKLAGMASTKFMLGGTQSLTVVYDQLVADVGSKTHTASVSRTAQDVLLNQATGARENIAGVNLDEEAANLIKFQNSYQAAARAVSVANSLFETLIGAVR